MQRINQKKTVEYLKQLYPEIKNEISTLSEGNNFAGIMQTTVDQLKTVMATKRSALLVSFICLSFVKN